MRKADGGKLTVNVGFETADDVADSTADETDDEASVAADFTSSTASARAAPAANAATAIEAKRIVFVYASLFLQGNARRMAIEERRKEGRCSAVKEKMRKQKVAGFKEEVYISCRCF